MSALTNDQIIAELRKKVEINPRTGNLRIHVASNDVLDLVERMGGTATVSNRLKVPELEVERWIDEHYVPDPFAQELSQLTGWSVWSIQHPPFWIEIQGEYWPKSGYLAARMEEAFAYGRK